MCAVSYLLLIHLGDGIWRCHKVGSGRENYALALLNLKLEVARSEQILVALIAACQLLAILEVVVPIWCCDKLGILLIELHMQPRESIVQATLNTIRDRICTAISLHISLRQSVLIAEGQQWAKTQRSLGVSIHQRIANHKLCAVMHPQQLLLENHATHTIGNRWHWSVLKVGDILMTTRLIHTLEAV